MHRFKIALLVLKGRLYTIRYVVILDIEMPICDGFAVAEAMRGQAASRPSIIAFAFLDEVDVIERGQEVQIDAFCRKGNALPTLRKLIEHRLRSLINGDENSGKHGELKRCFSKLLSSCH
jgi:DNA-binding response OmpR family regulator